ncbi:uncharacterized protein LOC141619702 [Silene latifolia]|uniref:uncharacterized protein LOC141619702 n=1 Tax=Silene latifolia TaxID=37657 RepID=UPI003D773994
MTNMRKMETEDRRGLDRVVFQKAYVMSSSFSCQVCVVGFIFGVGLTSLVFAALTSFVRFDLDSVQFHHIAASVVPWNSETAISNTSRDNSSNLETEKREVFVNPSEKTRCCDKEKVSSLVSAWSSLLNETQDSSMSSRLNVPKAPHLEDCKARGRMNKRLDTLVGNERFPPWTLWRGSLDPYSEKSKDEQLHKFRHQHMSEGAYPPWITGSDDENYPLTRKVQRDIWLHQHPQNCRDPKIKFLVSDFERNPGLGMGAQISGMCGVLAIALAEKRVLVTKYYNRADHDGCKGASRGSWSCYFLPETSQECRDRAFELMQQKEAWDTGIIKTKETYSSKEIWKADVPTNWGTPWSYLQPTTEVNGSFFAFHRRMERRWWLAQVVRYLMRFPSEHTCHLMNVERHSAFGKEAAEMVLASLKGEWSKDDLEQPESEIEKYVWWNHKPWIPRPLLSVHVRMGDKAREMQLVQFDGYMALADRIRKQFPDVKNIWLSTEMEEVVNMTSNYIPEGWKFYYSNVKRQVGNTRMATYEASLGRKTSTENPLVNYLMASDADYYIGALGSTWCHLIDGMRNTGGKVMAGYLSVNKDRFW